MTDAAPATIGTAEPAVEPATTTPAATPAAPTAFGDWRDTIPEKFRSIADSGEYSLNGEALVKSYANLEQRQGKFGSPVDSPDAYTRPADMDDAQWGSEEWAGARKDAAENGLTDKQFAFHSKTIASVVESVRQEITPKIDNARVELREIYKGDDGAMNKAIGLAQKAAMTYGIDLADPFIGNNAKLMHALAKVGGELGADGSIKGAVMSGTDLQSLRSNPAYMDDSHPEHKVIRERVRQHYLADAARKQ